MHVYTRTHQFKMITTIKTNLEKNEAYIVMDYSQNYVYKYNKEVQAVHFGASKKQVSMQNGGFYFRNDFNEINFNRFDTTRQQYGHTYYQYWKCYASVYQTWMLSTFNLTDRRHSIKIKQICIYLRVPFTPKRNFDLY